MRASGENMNTTSPITVDSILGQIHKRLDMMSSSQASMFVSDADVHKKVDQVLREKVDQVCNEIIQAKKSSTQFGEELECISQHMVLDDCDQPQHIIIEEPITGDDSDQLPRLIRAGSNTPNRLKRHKSNVLIHDNSYVINSQDFSDNIIPQAGNEPMTFRANRYAEISDSTVLSQVGPLPQNSAEFYKDLPKNVSNVSSIGTAYDILKTMIKSGVTFANLIAKLTKRFNKESAFKEVITNYSTKRLSALNNLYEAKNRNSLIKLKQIAEEEADDTTKLLDQVIGIASCINIR